MYVDFNYVRKEYKQRHHLIGFTKEVMVRRRGAVTIRAV